MVYMCHIFPVQSIIDGHLGWFQVLAIVNSAFIHFKRHNTSINVCKIYISLMEERDKLKGVGRGRGIQVIGRLSRS